LVWICWRCLCGFPKCKYKSICAWVYRVYWRGLCSYKHNCYSRQLKHLVNHQGCNRPFFFLYYRVKINCGEVEERKFDERVADHPQVSTASQEGCFCLERPLCCLCVFQRGRTLFGRKNNRHDNNFFGLLFYWSVASDTRGRKRNGLEKRTHAR